MPNVNVESLYAASAGGPRARDPAGRSKGPIAGRVPVHHQWVRAPAPAPCRARMLVRAGATHIGASTSGGQSEKRKKGCQGGSVAYIASVVHARHSGPSPVASGPARARVVGDRPRFRGSLGLGGPGLQEAAGAFNLSHREAWQGLAAFALATHNPAVQMAMFQRGSLFGKPC
jgi:hypothetical protein